jgi:hypothetical protein
MTPSECVLTITYLLERHFAGHIQIPTALSQRMAALGRPLARCPAVRLAST